MLNAPHSITESMMREFAEANEFKVFQNKWESNRMYNPNNSMFGTLESYEVTDVFTDTFVVTDIKFPNTHDTTYFAFHLRTAVLYSGTFEPEFDVGGLWEQCGENYKEKKYLDEPIFPLTKEYKKFTDIVSKFTKENNRCPGLEYYLDAFKKNVDYYHEMLEKEAKQLEKAKAKADTDNIRKALDDIKWALINVSEPYIFMNNEMRYEYRITATNTREYDSIHGYDISQFGFVLAQNSSKSKYKIFINDNEFDFLKGSLLNFAITSAIVGRIFTSFEEASRVMHKLLDYVNILMEASNKIRSVDLEYENRKNKDDE